MVSLRLVKKESISSEDMESSSLSEKWSRNLAKSEPSALIVFFWEFILLTCQWGRNFQNFAKRDLLVILAGDPARLSLSTRQRVRRSGLYRIPKIFQTLHFFPRETVHLGSPRKHFIPPAWQAINHLKTKSRIIDDFPEKFFDHLFRFSTRAIATSCYLCAHKDGLEVFPYPFPICNFSGFGDNCQVWQDLLRSAGTKVSYSPLRRFVHWLSAFPLTHHYRTMLRWVL